MLMSRMFGISRFETAWREKSKPWISLGDLAFVAVLLICLMEPHDRAWRHILRHGALMPLYLLVLYDLALGRGFVARAVLAARHGISRPDLVLDLHLAEPVPGPGSGRWPWRCPESKSISFWFAVIGLTVMAVISTYWIEKPLAKRLRRKLLPAQGMGTATAA